MSDFDEDITKQRRNLMLISFALIIFDFADVKIAKVGLLGTDLVIGRPIVIVISAWLIWLYLLLRYFQYWHAKNDSSFKNAYYRFLSDAVGKYAKNKYPDKPELSQSGTYGRAHIKIQWVKRGPDNKGTQQQLEKFSFARSAIWRSRAYLRAMIVTPHYTDTIFPFLIALAAPAVTLCTQWHELIRLFA